MLASKIDPGATLTYLIDEEDPKVFWGSEILAKRNFLGFLKDAGIFLVLKFSSAQINNNISHKRNLLLVWDLLGMLKKVGTFFR